jgi:hypothetical protein
MWNRALMRLFSLSFMSFFIIGLLWEEGRRRDEAAERKPVQDKRKDEKAREGCRSSIRPAHFCQRPERLPPPGGGGPVGHVPTIALQGKVKTISWLVAPAPPGVKEPAAT